MYKLGYTSNIEQRLSSHFSSNPGLEVMLVEKIKGAKEFETYFHKIYPAKKLELKFKGKIYTSNEWYIPFIYKNMLKEIILWKELINSNFVESYFNCLVIDGRLNREHYNEIATIKIQYMNSI